MVNEAVLCVGAKFKDVVVNTTCRVVITCRDSTSREQYGCACMEQQPARVGQNDTIITLLVERNMDYVIQITLLVEGNMDDAITLQVEGNTGPT